jgi:hypothetical protein
MDGAYHPFFRQSNIQQAQAVDKDDMCTIFLPFVREEMGCYLGNGPGWDRLIFMLESQQRITG